MARTGRQVTEHRAARRDGTRPLIALLQRFSASASALRHGAVVTARALSEAVLRAGGEPFMLHPGPPEEAAERLARRDGVLLPGGDMASHFYGAGAEVHDWVYDVDAEQDASALAVARYAPARGLPVSAVCRGLQVVNVTLGGTLRQDMGGRGCDHRHRVHRVALAAGSTVARALARAASVPVPGAGTGAGKAAREADDVEVSCHHHQCTDRLGEGLAVTGRAADGTVEALELPDRRGWFAAVQWHPEDTAATDSAQQGLFDALAEACGRRFS
ncbi:gamma-glutamyl-gamma-aminobutyrate hydrolase family protein [Streptomyces chrestomyceticus]|uniref:gamma-glutamyl-gamma-aminobutyrate hydrolase family protein n=1 Tax=Streptomyces chrestomyceticus TaxID=68185 RepID=UPI0033EDBEC5